MSAGIQLTQAGVVYNAAGAAHPAPIVLLPNVLSYVKFVGTPTPAQYTWAISRPAGSNTVISSVTSAGPSFVPDQVGWVGTVTLLDEHGNLYQLDITTAAATPGSVARSFSAVYSIASYGASTTGTGTQNVAAMVAACTDANAAGGGIVYVPEGTWPWLVPNTVGTGCFKMTLTNVTIQGAGRFSSKLIDQQGRAPNAQVYPTFSGTPDGADAFLTFVDSTNVHVTDLGFVGSGTYVQADLGRDAVGRKGVYFHPVAVGCTDCSVNACYFTLIEGEVFYADGTSTFPQTNVHFNNNYVYRCLSNGFNMGVGASGATACSGDNNVFIDCGGSPAQFGGVGTTFNGNYISMPSGFFATSDQVLLANALGCKTEDNQVIGINAKLAGVAIFNIGFQFDTNTTDISVRRNLFRQCKVLNTGHGGIIVVSASTGGATTKGIMVEQNDIVECADADHASYPGAQGIRFIGTQVTTGVVSGNNIDNRGVTNGLAIGVGTDAGTSVAGVVMKPNTFSSDVTTPYSLTVAPTTYPQTYTTTNHSNARTLDETGATTAQVAHALGTLIADLQAQGLIK